MRDFKVGRRGLNLAFYFVILDVIRLKLYTVDNSYIKQLYNVDTEVFYEPTGYDIKPYVGIIIQNNNYDYFIPLTSAKEKHKKWNNVTKTNYIIYELLPTSHTNIPSDWVYIKTQNNIKHILSVLEIKKMIPVPKGIYHEIKFSEIFDSSYLALLEKELKFIRPLWKTIQNKANAIYLDQKETGIVRNFYCNFSKLENVYQQSMSSNLITV